MPASFGDDHGDTGRHEDGFAESTQPNLDGPGKVNGTEGR
ncbi:hypothetical protein MINT15_00370 [Saccharomonospora viridis]|uniref:Uncharacterized protein n=2 Tax=Saccharomonospora viridis TaxID=1852 RepID=C7MVE9_SACVD|nr:hypothetical protein Svir_27970 [Saccharomonospora viridis DSM 43017]KHF45736.1 hypothetical protein MINT15_00370 [Saccharomonospora viridis]